MIRFKKIILLALTMLLPMFVYADTLKVLFVGQPQAGPPIIFTQALAKNLTGPWEFVSMKDCAGALRVINQNDNVLFVVADSATAIGLRQGESCVPPELKPRNIVGYSESTFHLCRKTDSKVEIGPQRFTLGIIGVLPVQGLVADFNKRNGTNAVGVAINNSSAAVSSLLAGNVDWATINPGIAEPLMSDGKIDCPYTFVSSGTKKVPKDHWIGKHYNMTMPNLTTNFFVAVKSKNSNVYKDVEQALKSENFQKFLDQQVWVNTKIGYNKFTDADMDRYFNYINSLLSTFYQTPGYNWRTNTIQ